MGQIIGRKLLTIRQCSERPQLRLSGHLLGIPACGQTLTSGVPQNFTLDPGPSCRVYGNWSIFIPPGTSQLRVDLAVSTPNVTLDVFVSLFPVTASSPFSSLCGINTGPGGFAMASAGQPGTVAFTPLQAINPMYYVAIAPGTVNPLTLPASGTVTATLTVAPLPVIAKWRRGECSEFCKERSGPGSAGRPWLASLRLWNESGIQPFGGEQFPCHTRSEECP